MKKIAKQMLMLVMALLVSQTTLADGNEKSINGKSKPNTERRVFRMGQHRRVAQANWKTMHKPTMAMKFDSAKWDSIKAAHPNFARRLDSIKAHRPNYTHRPMHMPMHRMDSLKAHRPMAMHRMAPRHFGMRPHFGPHRFGPHFPWMKGHKPAAEQSVESAAVKSSEMDATAITSVREDVKQTTYDLNGRQVKTQHNRGIVIRNGKKYAVTGR